VTGIILFPASNIVQRQINVSLQKIDDVTKESKEEAMEVLAIRLQSRWRFVRVEATEIALYPAAPDGADELSKIEALIPPGFKLSISEKVCLFPLSSRMLPNFLTMSIRYSTVVSKMLPERKAYRVALGRPSPWRGLSEKRLASHTPP
jgi:hypothetical protein